MKVWVLKDGSCGEYEIIGVFSSAANARDAVVLREVDIGISTEFDFIEEFEIDAYLEWRYGPVFKVGMHKQTGEINLPVFEHSMIRHPSECEVHEGPEWFHVSSPISEDHALKVATERRQQWLRTRQLNTPTAADAPSR